MRCLNGVSSLSLPSQIVGILSPPLLYFSLLSLSLLPDARCALINLTAK